MATDNAVFLWLHRVGPWAILLVACGILLAHALSYFVLVDDAFIVYRYAENLSEGHGLVFNPGERVEGYTDFLWVAILAIVYLLGASTPEASQVLGTASALAVLPVMYLAGRRVFGLDRWSSLLPCFIVAFSASVAMWAGSGLETPLYMTLFTAALALLLAELRTPPKLPVAGVLFALATLTRPEGAGMFFVACAGALVLRIGTPRTVLHMVIGFCLVFVPHLIFRLVYYGYPLPNTFYAKTGISKGLLLKGLAYSQEFLVTHGVWALLPVLALPFFAPGKERRLYLIPMAILLFTGAYIVSVGGDFMVYSRFYAPYLPWYVLLASAGAWYAGAFIASHRPNRIKVLPPLLVFVLAVSMIVPVKLWVDNKHSEPFKTMPTLLSVRKEFGEWLRRTYPPDTIMAVSALGIIPYYAKLPTIDILGLADEHIAHVTVETSDLWQSAAHFKYDSDYVLSRKPDIVPIASRFFFDYAEIDTGTLYNAVLNLGWKAPSDLMGKKEFRLHYAPRLAQLSNGVQAAYFERVAPPPDWKQFVERGNRSASTYYSLAQLYKQRGLYDEALAATRYADDLLQAH